MKNKRSLRRHSLIVYFSIAYLIPIIAMIIVTLKEGLSKDIVTTNISPISLVVIMAMVHAPTVAAIISVFRDQGFLGIRQLFQQLKFWKYELKWYLISLLIFPVTIVGTLLLLSKMSFDYAPVINLTILTFGTLISALWEEIGWTGYAMPKMLAKFSPLKVGIILGLVHAFWHLPANYWGVSIFHGDLFFVSFIITSVGIIALRIVSVWIYMRTKSLVLGWITHAGFTTGQLLFVSLALTSRETVVWQFAFMCSLIGISISILIRNRDLMKRSLL